MAEQESMAKQASHKQAIAICFFCGRSPLGLVQMCSGRVGTVEVFGHVCGSLSGVVVVSVPFEELLQRV
eukprot:3786390-Amphidinium_carterae.1